MADDGMLLNFEIGDSLPRPQPKFVGGRWQDRVKAQRGLKKWAKPATPRDGGSNDAAVPRYTPGDDAVADQTRPAKKQRVLANTSAPLSRRQNVQDSSKPFQIASRLFTSNPTATTVFTDTKTLGHDEAPTKPSNAPLSSEAESFHALGLSERISRHLSTKMALTAPTAIQKKTIPKLVQEDSDAFLQAETGSGKTLAYLLPIVQRIMALSAPGADGTTRAKINRNSGLFAMVLAPTRELCQQISVVLEKLLRCAPWIVSTTVKGGESKHSEKARLRKGVNILIATPGRLTDHLDNTKVLDVSTVRWLILDEGDRLMEMGFEDDIKAIVGKIRAEKLNDVSSDGAELTPALPKRRVTVLCSATMKMGVQKLGEVSLVDAVHIVAGREENEEKAVDDAGQPKEDVFAAPSQLKQSFVVVPAKLRLVTLIALLKAAFSRKGSVTKAIVFISCADSVDFHYELLKAVKQAGEEEKPPLSTSPTATTVSPAAYLTSPANKDITIHRLHGSLPQPVRTATLKAFSSTSTPSVLITTDISSRGLDLPSVDLVVEYDPAFSVADHVHRVGRTARAGKPGKASMFLLPGCEEGYMAIVSGDAAAGQSKSYEGVLADGFTFAVDLPVSPSDEDGEKDDPSQDKQTSSQRAEALQLHIEHRLLAQPKPDTPSGSTITTIKRKRTPHKPPPTRPPTSPLLESARKAFKSHIRAYATHVRDERVYFDITKLHLGHVAKSFGLREAPGGIGSGSVKRRVVHGGGKGAEGNGGKGDRARGEGGGKDDLDIGEAVDDGAAKRMKDKMKAIMSASSEFNIG